MSHDNLSIVNLQRQELSGPRLLHDLIAKSCEEATAIDFLQSDGTHSTFTYRNFTVLTQTLCQQIRRYLLQSSSKHHIIPVIIPQCPELYIAWRAVLEAGAGFCPVSPDVPSERFKFILNDVSADLVLCLEESVPRISELLPSLKYLSVSVEALELEQGDRTASFELHNSKQIDPRTPAYVQYTSGSSGLPKGVVVSHFSVTQSLLAHDEHIPTFKRFLQFASPTFDVSIFEVFFPFFRGATLVGCSREQMLADLPRIIRTLNADAAELTPTVAGTLLKTRKAAPCLKTLLTIGEMLSKSIVSEFGGIGDSDSMLYAMYGPTEAAIHCTLAPRLSAADTVRNIGVPLSTVTAFVLEEATPTKDPEIIMRGEAGELAVAGQLADGYLNRPDQNDAAFIDLPSYGQVYRTGDRAICRPDGQLEILGRMTSGQVKLRGQRVELGEIEEVASKTSGLSLAIASVFDDLLVLFCVADVEVSSAQIRGTCKAWLPAFMRPGDIVILKDGMPRLPSGKVDKKQLERDYQKQIATHAYQDDGFVNEQERTIARVIRETLNRDVNRNTSLWSVGMDSLRAIRMSAKLRPAFPQLSVSMLLEANTVADIVTSVFHEGEHAQSTLTTEISLEPSNWSLIAGSVRQALEKQQLPRPVKILPCSSTQIGMLVETSASPGLNFNSITVNRQAGISHDDLCKAVLCLTESNELLRSGFSYTGNSSMPFAQVIWEQLECHDLDLLHPLQVDNEDDKGGTSIIRLHHALYDGWSWELILDDLNTILTGEKPPSRPGFQIFANYQTRKRMEQIEQGLAFWENLRLDSGSSSLPCLASGSQQSEREEVRHGLDLSYGHLSRLAEHLQVSRQAFLQSCWARLISLYTDSAEVIFGNVISGRHASLRGVDQIIGPCLSTLPMKIDLHAVNTFEDLVAFVHRQNIRSLECSEVSLHDIMKCNERSKYQKPFDTLFVWQQGEVRPPEMRKHLTTACTRDSLDYGAVIEIEPFENKIQARLTVDTGRIPAAHAKLLLDQLNVSLTQMAENLNKCMLNLNPWEAAESKVLSISNPVYQSFDQSFDLFTTIAKLAIRDPHKPAVRYVSNFDAPGGKIEIQTVSYGSLYRKACAAAAALIRRRQIKADDLVCVVANKSIDLYTAILAVAMTGAGYMCIDPQTPIERVKQILQQANCAAALTDGSVDLSEVYHGDIRISEIVEESKQYQQFKPRSSKGNNLAYCVWTSGTTGKPKGVLITRQNLLSNLNCLSTVYPCNPKKDALLQACSPAFDVSVFEIFWTWYMGMTLCAAPNDVLFRDLEKLIDTLDVTHLSMTPSVAALVKPDNVPKVKMLVTAGEPMNSKVFENWAGRGLYQGYGPSETTNICNIWANVQPNDFPNNVGPAFSNTSLFICVRSNAADEKAPLSPEDFQILPKGAVGEVWIGGDQVARGYVDQMLTHRNFLDHPQYGRLYRSGDIGRLLADGSLVILGRDDQQTKVRGQRVELGEVSGALIKDSHVEDAASFVHQSNDRDRLLSFCSIKLAGQPLSEVVTRLFRGLESALPSYIIPDHIIPVESMPLTRQGKIDKRALARRYADMRVEDLQPLSRYSESDGDDEELDPIEQEIAEALAAALNVQYEEIRRSSSFYALGLDSINCIRLSQLLNKNRLNQVDVSAILRHPSVKLLKPILITANDTSRKDGENSRNADQYFGQDTVDGIRSQLLPTALEIDAVLPCTDLQLSMLSSSDASSAKSYQNKLRFSVYGDIGKLKWAWESVKARQPLLRTTFVKVNLKDMPYAQVVLRDVALPWHDSPSADCNDSLPYKFRVKREKDNSVVLTLVINHALYDAEAMSVLLDEVQAAFREKSIPAAVPFTGYLDYMINLDESSTDHFWSKQLSRMKPCRLALTLPIQSLKPQGSAEGRLKSRISTLKLEAFARNQSTTILAILQTSLARLLSCYLEVSDICFGNVYSGRNLPVKSVERIVGPCFNTLPVRAQCKATLSNLDLLRQLQNLNVELMPLQPSSPRRIQRLNSSDGSSLFDILLLLQRDQSFLDVDIWELDEDSGDMSFPFILEVLPSHTSDKIELTLHSEVTEADTLLQILHHFDILLDHTTSYPQARARDFSSISDSVSRLNIRPRESTTSKEGWTDALESLGMLSAVEAKVRNVLLQFASSDQVRVTKQTTIFQLGLDSINAVQIAAKLREAGYQISSATVLESPSVAEIAIACSSRRLSLQTGEQDFDFEVFDKTYRGHHCQRLGLDSSIIESIRPCTPTQSGILSEYLRSDGGLYYNTMHLQLEPNLDKDRLLRSWETVVGCHEMLRTGFAENDDGRHPFVMITYQPETFRIPVGESASKQFEISDLAQPAWHLSISSDPDNSVLAVSMLHALYDIQSMDFILADVARAYQHHKLAPATSVAPTLSSILSRCETEGAKGFWRQERNLVQPTKFPDLNINSNQRWTSSSVAIETSLSFTVIQQRCAKLGCSLQVVCQAAWAQVLASYTGQQRVTFGLIFSGRDFGDERDEAAFPCINTVPFTIELEDEKREMLNKISKLNAGLIKYQYTPLTSIKRWQAFEGEVFDSILVLQKIESKQTKDAPWLLIKGRSEC